MPDLREANEFYEMSSKSSIAQTFHSQSWVTVSSMDEFSSEGESSDAADVAILCSRSLPNPDVVAQTAAVEDGHVADAGPDFRKTEMSNTELGDVVSMTPWFENSSRSLGQWCRQGFCEELTIHEAPSLATHVSEKYMKSRESDDTSSINVFAVRYDEAAASLYLLVKGSGFGKSSESSATQGVAHADRKGHKDRRWHSFFRLSCFTP